ncbi:MAG: DHH family phosphoesterase [Campylobacterales bacterium]
MSVEILRYIENSNKISIITHKNIDADSYGSALSMYEYITSLGKTAKVVNIEEIPLYLKKFDESIKPLRKPPKSDLAIFVDCADLARSGFSRDDFNSPIITIDHHLRHEAFADIELIDENAAATGVVVYNLLRNSQKGINSRCASAILLAIASDSLFFSTDRVDSECFAIASHLLELGANLELVDRVLNKSSSLAKIRLKTEALKSLELLLEGRLGLITLKKQDFKSSGAHISDTEGFASIPLELEIVEVAVFLVELEDRYKLSFRSKKRDVSEIAKEFSGGGHRLAAGGKLHAKSIEEAKNIVIQKFREIYEKK